MIVWSCCGYERAPPHAERVRWLGLQYDGVQLVPLSNTKRGAIAAYDAAAAHRAAGHHWPFAVCLERVP